MKESQQKLIDFVGKVREWLLEDQHGEGEIKNKQKNPGLLCLKEAEELDRNWSTDLLKGISIRDWGQQKIFHHSDVIAYGFELCWC